MVNTVKEINDSVFATEVLNQEKPVLVYFWANWCGPCRLVSPSINSIGEEYQDQLKVVKLEVDKNKEAVSICKVEGVPALILFKNNEIIASYEGAMTKDQIKNILETNL